MRVPVGVMVSILLFAGCSSQSVPSPADADGGADQKVVDVHSETASPETVEHTDTLVPEVSFDAFEPADTTGEVDFQGPACEAGEGCFLDECEKNTDCLSGWCVEHMGQKVCSITCQEECPTGWTCSQVGASDPDVVFICVSDFSNLCRPCTAAADCEGVAGTEDACVDYGAEGAFCGGKCGDDQGCPWGFSCQTATTVDGVEVKQCVAETGVCPCTTTAANLGLFTYCEVANEFGTCLGKRVCTADGLSDCDAQVPAAEECNGIDDDCNGLTDELDQDDGTPVCDDGNECTSDTCNGEDGCSHEELDEGECLDGDACTIGDHCEAGKCVGQPIQCDDGDPCTEDICDGLGGCATEFNTAACDDQDPCTVKDTCEEGVCSGYQIDCECQTDADCGALEDGDLCNGTLVCDTSKLPHLCQVDPDTVVDCPAPEPGPDAVCQAAACDADTGVCSIVPTNEGYACEDGNACTIGDKCVEGSCVGGVALNCNDGNLCTDDSCDPDDGCVYANNTAPCEDGDFCTTNDACSDGACAAGDAVDCDDGNVCNGTESCHSASGCLPGQALVCDDGAPCNGQESCDSAEGCQEGAALVCDDGNVCNGAETCAPGLGCKPGSALTCDDADPCNGVESCHPKDGCVEGEALVCDDGNVCNGEETCTPGKGCTPGTPLYCEDDDNVCTDTACVPETGCITLLNTAPCDDDDVCTTGDHCELGSCVASGSLTCNDNNPCTADSCAPDNGCVFVPTAGDCDDGNACTTGDQCTQGTCLSTGMKSCDDDNVCTDDVCVPETGCVFTNNEVACNDGDACTQNDQCLDGACTPGDAVECNDGQFCNGTETCDKLFGCLPGMPPVLDDQVVCTVDSCDESQDIVLHVPNDAACSNDQFCDGEETCDAVADCLPGTPPEIDDGNGCTIDSCDEVLNVVVHEPIEPKTYQFTNCGKSGYTGPSQANCDSAYAASTLAGAVTLSAGVQSWTVPKTGTYTIQAVGAGGGRGKQYNTNVYSSGVPGKGARMKGTFTLNEGDVLKVLVGHKGQEQLTSKQKGGGGGGGTFVVLSDGTPLVVAGGGGGSGRYDGNNGDDGVTGTSGTSGNGANGAAGGTDGNGGLVSGCSYAGNSGSGIFGNGKSACGNSYYSKSYTNGGEASDWNHCWSDGNAGGFGGGGATGPHGGGGGGGYSGGGGGGDINCGGNGGGGGGGSINAGSAQDNQAGYQSADGSVTITFTCE